MHRVLDDSISSINEKTLMNQASFQIVHVEKAWSWWTESRCLLTVVQGRAWATLVGAMDQVNPDIFLCDGQAILIPANQHIVLESWPRHAADPLVLHWQIAYDALVDPSLDQGIACPPAAPRRSPVKAT